MNTTMNRTSVERKKGNGEQMSKENENCSIISSIGNILIGAETAGMVKAQPLNPMLPTSEDRTMHSGITHEEVVSKRPFMIPTLPEETTCAHPDRGLKENKCNNAENETLATVPKICSCMPVLASFNRRSSCDTLSNALAKSK
ncbi:hypothetical protein Y032_0559g3438 [Ancylostoma ceylanicum]|uniref:Uncharacterized protein n=1 Tax=Ancylostoma ceylanicum TaxID=53326 RepID=A0A016WPU2_9BILA|nr:hypothetical protein Y032_0559g3438 [Ancylostoma ceylanicum]